MHSKASKPGCGGSTGLGMSITAAIDTRVYIPCNDPDQQAYDPVSWLIRRCGVARETAKAYAEINRFGGANG